MISDILSREFVLEQLKAIRSQLREDAGGREGGGPGAEELGTADYAVAAEIIDETLVREEETPSGPKGFDPPPSGRRGDRPIPIAETSFMSSDPIVNITQSALEFYFNHPDSKDKASPEAPAQAPRRGASSAAPPVTTRALARRRVVPGPANRRIFDAFSVTDPAWVSSLVAMGIRKFKAPHAFNRNPPPAVELNSKCRVVMVGDWGSGIPRAQNTARAMRVYVEDAIKKGLDCQVVHLGDVYYSGWEFEYLERFLPYWPVNTGEEDKVGSWSLNGNHDMYSGGHAFFDTLLADARFRRQNRSSFFRMFTPQWQILGLDTSYDDNGLTDPQAAWVADTVFNNPQHTMLLTHHQLYSAYEDAPAVGQMLRQRLGGLLDAGKIEAAIWGHEHRCVLHEPSHNVKYGRLVGHGGVPVYMTHAAGDAYPKPATYEDRRYIKSGLEHWAYMGFAVFDFDGARVDVSYVDENGYVDKTESFV
jgi:hypothetical protein